MHVLHVAPPAAVADLLRKVLADKKNPGPMGPGFLHSGAGFIIE